MEADKKEKQGQDKEFTESGNKKPAETTTEGTKNNNWDAKNPIERDLDK
ncbi:hypothetical protein GCM10007424_12640 [Flavobacterium suaedae]|uniref:Uncharacterized protein n=1 Tax=Flavobacterium suaedae TaxID=1767027 RepID=A0ABQ1JTK6_9FLAO|nr:hypothetical protein [Flavobacterium suaedae]GGB74192.1 hypothetical protein GCM10007424_12640 [Flavobacterium suaedae]